MCPPPSGAATPCLTSGDPCLGACAQALTQLNGENIAHAMLALSEDTCANTAAFVADMRDKFDDLDPAYIRT